MNLSGFEQKLNLLRKAAYVFAVQYHGRIPKRVLQNHIRKFRHEQENIRKYGRRFFDPENPGEYAEWLSFQSCTDSGKRPDLCYISDGARNDVSCAVSAVFDPSLLKAPYTCFLEHDTVLYEPFMMYASCCEEADVLYFDSDRIDSEGKRFSPHMRTDFAYETLRSYNCIGTCFIVRTDLLTRFAGMPYDPYRFLLELSDQDCVFRHIPKVCYGERREEQSGIDTLRAYFEAHQISAEIEARGTAQKVTYALPSEPKITVMIPTRDGLQNLRRCIGSIREKTSYGNYEILIIDNGSREHATLDYFSFLQKSYNNIRVIRDDGDFNFSRLNNEGAEKADGDYLVMLNDDMEVISENWLEAMLSFAQRERTGAVGAMLYYPDRTIQHAGVISGKGGAAAHRYYRAPENVKGYMHALDVPENTAAVTAACLMVSRKKYHDVKGMDEALSVNYNDYDLCMRLYRAGYASVFLPDVKLIHYESKSRGLDRSREKVDRYMKEIALVQERYAYEILHDPFYSDNFDKNYDYRLIAGTGSN